MKVLWILIMVALLMSGCAGWTKIDNQQMNSFSTITAFAVIDYNQSVEVFYHRENFYELNPILGERPTRREMLLFGCAGMGLLWILVETLPDPWPRILLDSAVSSESFNIEDNALIMDGYRRRINAMPIIITIRF